MLISRNVFKLAGVKLEIWHFSHEYSGCHSMIRLWWLRG